MTTIFSVAYSGVDHGEEFKDRTFNFTETCPDKSVELFENEYSFCVEAKNLIEDAFRGVTVKSVQPALCVQ